MAAKEKGAAGDKEKGQEEEEPARQHKRKRSRSRSRSRSPFPPAAQAAARKQPLYSEAELRAFGDGRFWADYFSRGKPVPPNLARGGDPSVRACGL
jgi:hypothetical protein